jgi:pimeloyl-ACP methyl ester carboxylesterase
MNEVFPGHIAVRMAGFSFGSQIATLVAAELGMQVQELVLIGVAALRLHHAPFAKERTGMGAAERAAVHRDSLAVLRLADPGKIDAQAIYLQTENVRRALPQPAVRRLRRARDGPGPRPGTPADDLGHPGRDRPAVAGGAPGGAAPASSLQVRLIEGAGHWVMYEAP